MKGCVSIFKETFFSSNYLVNEDGIVIRKDGKIIKQNITNRGYKMINFCIDGKQIGKSVHTLVARAFCDGYEEGLVVNHKDGNKLNNNANNLEWVTPKQNSEHAVKFLSANIGGKNGNAKKVYAYDKKTLEFKYEFESVMDAARFFAGNEDYKRTRHIQNIICAVANNKPSRKSYKGMIWSYSPLLSNQQIA